MIVSASDERHEHGDGQRDRQRVKELPFDAGEQAERQEHDDRRDRRRRDRPDELLHRLADRGVPIGLSCRCRTMFSVITTASSITRPIAIAIAPSVIRLNVCPTRDMTNTVIAIVSGIDDALIAVMRAWRRKMQQHDHREHRADEHRVAHRRHRVAHERRLIVHRLETHARRQRLAQRRGDAPRCCRRSRRCCRRSAA